MYVKGDASVEHQKIIDLATTAAAVVVVVVVPVTVLTCTLTFLCPEDHETDWKPRILLGMVEARSVSIRRSRRVQIFLY